MKKIELKDQICFLQECLKFNKGSKNRILETINALKEKQDLEYEIVNPKVGISYADIKLKNSQKIEIIDKTLRQILPDIEHCIDFYIFHTAKNESKNTNRFIKECFIIKDKIYSDVFGDFGYKISKGYLKSFLGKLLDLKIILVFLAAVYMPYFICASVKFNFVPDLSLEQILFKAFMGSLFSLLLATAFLPFFHLFSMFLHKFARLVFFRTFLPYIYFVFCLLSYTAYYSSALLFCAISILALAIVYHCNKIKIISGYFIMSVCCIIIAFYVDIFLLMVIFLMSLQIFMIIRIL